MSMEKFKPIDVMSLLNAKIEMVEIYHKLLIGGLDKEEARAFMCGACPKETRMLITLWLDREDALEKK